MQNAHYAEAPGRGRTEAESIPDVLDAVMAILQPIVACNRVQVENGRTYLREMVFGDPAEPRHSEALHIVAQTEEAIAAVLGRNGLPNAGDAATSARIVSAVMFLSMAGRPDPAFRVEDIVQDIRTRIRLLLPAGARASYPPLWLRHY